MKPDALDFRVIAMSGPMGCGKTALVEMLMQMYPGYQIINFADTLREVVQLVYDIPTDYQKLGTAKAAKFVQFDGKTLRHVLQFLGTEAFRYINPLTWVDNFERKVDKAKLLSAQGVMVEDCRFKNERERVRKLGGVIVYVYRPAAHDALMRDYAKHNAPLNRLKSIFGLPHFKMHQSELEIVHLYHNADFVFHNVNDITTDMGCAMTKQKLREMIGLLFEGGYQEDCDGECDAQSS